MSVKKRNQQKKTEIILFPCISLSWILSSDAKSLDFFLIALFAESVLDDVRIWLMIRKIYNNLILTFMEAVPYRGSHLCRNI